MRQAWISWIYVDGEERYEMDGAMYMVRDFVPHENGTITFTLSPPPSINRSEVSEPNRDQNSAEEERNSSRTRVLRRIRSRVTRFGRRARR